MTLRKEIPPMRLHTIKAHRAYRRIRCSSSKCDNCPFRNETEFGLICNIKNPLGELIQVYKSKLEKVV